MNTHQPRETASRLPAGDADADAAADAQRRQQADAHRPTFEPWHALEARFEVGATVGSGTFGKVKRAKVIKDAAEEGDTKPPSSPPLSDSTQGASSSSCAAIKMVRAAKQPHVLVTFRNEVSILREVSHHPNIVQFHGAFVRQDGAVHAMAMEFLGGGELFGWIQRHGNGMSERDASTITRQVLLALRYLHDEFGIAHRDISASEGRRERIAPSSRHYY